MIFKVFHSLLDHRGIWNQILPENHHLRAEQLLPLEQSELRDIAFLYLVCYEQDEIVAIAYFQHVHFKERHYKFPLSGSKLIQPFEKLLMRKGYRILVCGNLFRVDFPGIYMRPGRLTATVLFNALDQFCKEVKPKPVVFLLKDWKEVSISVHMKSSGYQPWPGDLTMKLDIRPEWLSFHDYTLALKHKYAQRLRKIQSRGKSIIRKELSLEDVIRYGDQIESLYCNVVKQQVIRLVIATKQYFIQMKQARGTSFKVIGYFEEDQLIGFSSHNVYDQLWELHYIGMDYIKNEQYSLYFNIMFDGIKLAIDEKKKAVELGRTAREAKAMIGAQPIYFNSYFRLSGWLVNILVNRFAGAFHENAGHTWQVRQPFKNA